MSVKTLIISGLGLRGVMKVKSPNESILSIFEQFCANNKIAPKDYALFKESTKTAIDMTLPVRLSGLVNKELLDILRVQRVSTGKARGKCKIALAHPSGRKTSQIPVSFNLIECLFAMEKEHEMDLFTTTKGNEMNMAEFVINQRQAKTIADFTKNLSFFGIKKNSNCLIRCMYKKKPINKEYIEKINNLRKEFSKKSETSQAKVKKVEKSTKDNQALLPPKLDNKLKKTEKLEEEVEGEDEVFEVSVAKNDLKVIPLSDLKSCKNVKLFKVGSGTPTIMDDLDDSVFEARKSDVGSLGAWNQKDEPLKTKKIRDLEKKKDSDKRQRKFLETKIRVRFRSGLILQGTFDLKTGKLKHVKDMVRAVLVQPNREDQAFYFYIAPPVRKFSEEEMKISLEQLNLFPAVLLNISSVTQSKLEIKRELVEEYLLSLDNVEEIPKNILKKRKRTKEEIIKEIQDKRKKKKRAKLNNVTGGNFMKKESGGDTSSVPKFFRRN